ncbi:MAG: glutamate--tRNA ligase [Rickettsiaceae bacterium]|nr:MAG: glutamate--tRNA ligase [Rickettsiaceae bacterium]
MTKIITRFAPSPTGTLHIGNARTAIINWLYAKKHQGEFILRFDDTDINRSKEAYKQVILNDLAWLGLSFDQTFNQLSRTTRYNEIKDLLIKNGRLYPCFESEEELQIKRKVQLANKMPPIYDKHALTLSHNDINSYLASGKQPHYRFKIEPGEISWLDMIKGRVKYLGQNLSDPIVIREDGSMTYMLCSVIDDIDYEISHIIRGEDHVSNTALQVQMFEALQATKPNFGHLSLVKAREEKISKRIGGFEIGLLRDILCLEPMAVVNFFALVGSAKQLTPHLNLKDLINDFDINSYSKSPTTYQPTELERLNHKILINLSYEQIIHRIEEIGLSTCDIDEKFWLAIRPNLQTINEIKDWWQICSKIKEVQGLDKTYLCEAARLLPPGDITINTWTTWTQIISQATGKKGKDLFVPLRLALTGMDQGPELKNILPIIGRQNILSRLTS